MQPPKHAVSTSHVTGPAVFATCSADGLPEVIYTDPDQGAYAVTTILGGQPLSTWREVPGPKSSYVLGLSPGNSGETFAVTADSKTASVKIPVCQRG